MTDRFVKYITCKLKQTTLTLTLTLTLNLTLTLKREATKKAHYSKMTTPARLPAGSVIPFVIEALFDLRRSIQITLISVTAKSTFIPARV